MTDVKVTKTKSKTCKVRMTFDIWFPSEPGEAQDRAFATIGRILSGALPTNELRREFLDKFEKAREESLKE